MHSRYCTRDQSSLDTSTKHPIFLLQIRDWIVTDIPDGWYVDDEGNIVSISDENAEPLSYEELSKMSYSETDCPMAVETWRTESVFLTRQEAEEWARARNYRWKDGWRVYCVSAEGELAFVVQDGTEIPGNRKTPPGQERSE